jgi:hypothetical protein
MYSLPHQIILELDRDALASRAPSVSANSTAPEASYVLKASCEETARSWVNAMRDAPIANVGWLSGDAHENGLHNEEDEDDEHDDDSTDEDEVVHGHGLPEDMPTDACAIEVKGDSFTVSSPTQVCGHISIYGSMYVYMYLYMYLYIIHWLHMSVVLLRDWGWNGYQDFGQMTQQHPATATVA